MTQHHNTKISRIKELVKNEKFDEALENIDMLLEADPKNQEVLFIKAKLKRQTQQYSEAINILQFILKIDPGNKEATNLKAMTMDILRSQQLDIYSSTNLSNDPWLD